MSSKVPSEKSINKLVYSECVVMLSLMEVN